MRFLLTVTLLLLGLGGCAHTGVHSTEQVLWPHTDAIRLVAFSHNEKQTLAGERVNLGEDNNLQLTPTANGLRIRWRDAGWAGLRLEAEPAADWRGLDGGYLNLMLTVVQTDAGTGIELGLDGVDGMERRLQVDRDLQSLAGEGQRPVSLPISCLLRDSDNASEIPVPLRLVLGGRGELILHRAAIAQAPAPQAVRLACPDPASLSTTPAMLDASWARSWWLPRHEHKLAEADAGDPQVVFLGDSITQGWENAGAGVFEEYFGHWRTLNLGFSGDRTENVLWRLQHGAVDNIDPELVVLMIGTNNTGHRQDEPAWVARGVESILDELTSRLPDSKILMLAIFPRSAEADDLPRRNNTLINARLRNFADGERVFFHDLNSVFLDRQGNLPEAVMPDLLHPNEHGYRLLARELAPLIDTLINTP